MSSRGSGGGFRLARDPSAISLADIVEAVEGPIALTACVEHGRQDCGIDHHCQVKPHWGAVNDALRGALAGVSLATLATPKPFVLSAVEAHAPGDTFEHVLRLRSGRTMALRPSSDGHPQRRGLCSRRKGL